MSLHRVITDDHRFSRTGFAEAIYSPGKRPEEIAAIGHRLDQARSAAGEDLDWPILATRVAHDDLPAIKAAWKKLSPNGALAWDADASMLELAVPGARRPIGIAAVVSAGTTDREPAAEAACVLAAYGSDVARLDDVGVAGIHRLLDPARLETLRAARVVIVVAGMEGALPSVVAGLVSAPVIAVPSPVGYGVSAGGHAALNAMLASCAPGLAVVNIGNGFGAAALAVKILRGLR